MKFKRHGKWTRRLKKVAAPAAAVGVTTVLTTVIAGGTDGLKA